MRLPKQALRGIPRAVGPIKQPAPIRGPRRHHPNRPSARSGKMSHRAIHGDYEVRIDDNRGGLIEIGKVLREVDQATRFGLQPGYCRGICPRHQSSIGCRAAVPLRLINPELKRPPADRKALILGSEDGILAVGHTGQGELSIEDGAVATLRRRFRRDGGQL